jgi:2-keto-4-pentenoate hydratase
MPKPAFSRKGALGAQAMTNQEIAVCAEVLAEARRTGKRIKALPAAPASAAEAHMIQDRVAAALREAVGGFKINALPGDEPTRGLIYARMIRPSPAKIALAEAPHLGVEAEIAFRFARDLPARDRRYSREEVVEAMAALPAIEIVSSRFRDPLKRPPLEQLADNLINGALVPGTETREWSRLDLARLHVTVEVNGETVVSQRGGHAGGDPAGFAVALVNAMRDAGGVKAGQIVTTGSWTGLRFLKPGDRCSIRFEALGGAEVIFQS